jgi:hypothetical protein
LQNIFYLIFAVFFTLIGFSGHLFFPLSPEKAHISTNYSGKNNFRNKFIEFARNDQVIDKNELDQLKKIFKNTSSPERDFADEVLRNLAKYKDRIRLTYTLQETDSNEEIELDFAFTPTYSEQEKISGNTKMEYVANISQKDTLPETKSDEDRCGPASLINAYIIMGGNFSRLANKNGINKDFTYKNIHLLQEKIYDLANNNGLPGIESGYKYTSNQDTGEISNVRGSGEIMIAADKVGLSLKPILGPNTRTIYQRKDEINRFFRINPNGAVQVGVHLDIYTGVISSPTDENPQDHSIIVFKQDKTFYMIDSSGLNNGNLENVKRLNSKGLNTILYNTSAIINSLTLL